LTMGQDAWVRFGFEVVAESGLVAEVNHWSHARRST
jgi:hypothetical protein